VRLYLLETESKSSGDRPLDVEGAHRWHLPRRIGCPSCGVYGANGPAYPSVDLSGQPDEPALRDPTPASWRQFVELRDRVRPLLPADAPLPPGTALGPFIGTVRGTWGDFALADIGHLLVRSAAYDRLRRAGVRLPVPVAAVLQGPHSEAVRLLELAVRPLGRLAPDGYRLCCPEPCATCGRWDRELQRVVVERASLPGEHADILRPLNHPTILLATARFVEAVDALELGGLSFAEVEIC
jgi:uncharacterized double-CXXCG motif protein